MLFLAAGILLGVVYIVYFNKTKVPKTEEEKRKKDDDY